MRHALLGAGDAAVPILQALVRRHQVAPAPVPGLPVTEPAPAPLPPLGPAGPDGELPPALEGFGADSADGAAPQVLHLVFSPDELAGERLAAWIARLRAGRPGLRIELHADRWPASPQAVRVAGAACCWMPAAGPAGPQAMAAWLLQRLAGDSPAEAPATAADGRLLAWSLTECRADLQAVRQHLAEVLLGQLLGALRQGQGPTRPPSGAGEAAGLPAPPAGDDLSPGAAQAGAMWQRLSLHYQTLAAQCEPARQAAELRRLVALGVHEGFDGRGVEAAMHADDARLQTRARDWAAEVETRLWQDWRAGRLALDAVAQAARELAARLQRQREEVRQRGQQDEALAAELQAALDRPVPTRGLGRWFGGAARPDLAAAAHALQAWAQARTTAARTRRDERQIEAAQAALRHRIEAIEAADLALGSLAAEAGLLAGEILADEQDGPQRLDRPAQVRALARTWVGGEGVEARQRLMRLRADLFLRLGEAARFETLAHQIGEGPGCEALRRACEQAIAAPVTASVAQSGVQWLLRRWEDEALRARELAALQPRLAGEPAVQRLMLAAALRERVDPGAAVLPTLGPRAAALAWLALSPPLEALPPLPVMAPEPEPVPVPEPAPPEAAALPDWAPQLLLAEALDLLRETPQGWLRAELDEAGLELALHPLGADWAQMLARLQAEAGERRSLLEALAPLRAAVPMSARLREVIARRVARLDPAWAAAAARALAGSAETTFSDSTHRQDPRR